MKASKLLSDEITAILFRHDPIGINFDSNTDEYEPETRTILPRLEAAASKDEALKIIHEEFVRWFDSDIAGPEEKYVALADEVWSAWPRFKKQ